MKPSAVTKMSEDGRDGEDEIIEALETVGGHSGWYEAVPSNAKHMYPLVNLCKTMENQNFEWENLLYMIMFNISHITP